VGGVDGAGRAIDIPEKARQTVVMSSRRVLVVDDDPGMRALLCRAAKHAGLEPFEAGSLNAALLRAHEVMPIGVVTDWDLGDGHGGQLFEMLRERLGAGMPGILLTARAEELDAEDTEPFLDVLEKPFDLATLLDAFRVIRWRARPKAVSGRELQPVVADILGADPIAEGDG